MKLESFTIYQFALPLRQPLTVAGHAADARHGGLVSWKADANVVGWGEISPLPGLSTESLDQALGQAAEVCRGLVGSEVSMDTFWSGEGLASQDLYPSVAFGIETSLLDLFARRSGLGLAQILVDDPAESVPVAGLLHGASDAVVDRARRLVAAGYRCLKLKVGRGDWRQDVDVVERLRSEVPDPVILRLDANRAWNLADAIGFARAVGPDRIDYVEEPLAQPRDLPEFVGESEIPVALDETIVESGVKLLSRLDRVAAVVMKPTQLGGVRAVVRLSERCWEDGITPVISSSFESSVGLLALAGLSAALQGPNVAAGLGTTDWFGSDTMEPGLLVENGVVDVEGFGRSLQWVQSDRIQEVARG